MSLIQYQGSDSREVLGHLTQQGSCADIPEFQRFIPEHHHQVLPKEDHIHTQLPHPQELSIDQKVYPTLKVSISNVLEFICRPFRNQASLNLALIN